MNLNLHYDLDPVNLGMVRIKGSMPAERVENLVKERLHEFGLKMEDIIAATIDGASVIKSFGRMICCVHQLWKIIILGRIQNFLQKRRWKKLMKLLQILWRLKQLA